MNDVLETEIEMACGRYRFKGKCRKNGITPNRMSFVLYAVQMTLSLNPHFFLAMKPTKLFWARINRDASNVIWFRQGELTLNESIEILDRLFLYAEKNMEMI